jgi:hypothetical protein
LRVNAVGWSGKLKPPKYPKDDSNISKRMIPEEQGARPRHCGSGKHWDPECKHSFKGNRSARVGMVQLSEDEIRSQSEYDDLHYGLDSDSEDFCSPLQIIEVPIQLAHSSEASLKAEGLQRH